MSEFDCRRNIFILGLYTLCLNAVFILPVFMAFYRDEMGLTFHDLLIAESVFAATLILLDVPCGYFADRFGRKASLVLGAIFYALGLGILYIADGLYGAIAAQATIGIGVSFASGANSAILYDTLLSAGRESEFRRFEGLRFALGLYACAAACVIGGYLYTLDHSAPILVEIFVLICALVAGLALREPPRHQKAAHHNPLKDIAETVVYTLRGHKDIGFIVLLMVFIFSTTKICMWSLQPYAAALSWPESVNGWVIATVMLLGGLSGHFGHHLFPKLDGRRLCFVLLGALTVLIALSGLLITPLGIVFLGCESLIFGFGMPRIQEYLNARVESHRRATILSTANFATSLGFIPLSQIIGVMNDAHGIGASLLLHAAILAGFGLLLRVLSARSTFAQIPEIIEEPLTQGDQT
ncbi:MAG: MFS transporter [Pseudobdellovibrionaceae bacterium]